MKDRLTVDDERVYTTGYSNGGMISYRLVCQAGDVFRAAAPAAGAFYTSFSCNQNPGLLHEFFYYTDFSCQ